MQSIQTNFDIQAIWSAWAAFDPVAHLRPIHDESSYDQAVALMNALLDVVGDDEEHELAVRWNWLAMSFQSTSANTTPFEQPKPTMWREDTNFRLRKNFQSNFLEIDFPPPGKLTPPKNRHCMKAASKGSLIEFSGGRQIH